MTKGERATIISQHAVVKTRVKIGAVEVGHVTEQIEFDGRADDGCRFEHGPGATSKSTGPGEHGIAHRRRNLATRGKNLGDEEWVAAGASVQGFRVHVVPCGKRGDSVRRQWGYGEPVDLRGRQVAEDLP